MVQQLYLLSSHLAANCRPWGLNRYKYNNCPAKHCTATSCCCCVQKCMHHAKEPAAAAVTGCCHTPLLRVKSAPNLTSSSTRAGPSRHTASTALHNGQAESTRQQFVSEQLDGRLPHHVRLPALSLHLHSCSSSNKVWPTGDVVPTFTAVGSALEWTTCPCLLLMLLPWLSWPGSCR